MVLVEFRSRLGGGTQDGLFSNARTFETTTRQSRWRCNTRTSGVRDNGSRLGPGAEHHSTDRVRSSTTTSVYNHPFDSVTAHGKGVSPPARQARKSCHLRAHLYKAGMAL